LRRYRENDMKNVDPNKRQHDSTPPSGTGADGSFACGLPENRGEFIEKLVNFVPSLIFIYDLEEHRNLFVNDRIQDMLGYSPEEIQGMGGNFIHNLIHPDDVDSLLVNTRNFQNCPSGTVITQAYRMRSKDGQWHWMEEQSRVLTRNQDGKPLSILGVSTDITKRKNAIRELERSERQNRSLFEDAPCPIFIGDLEGRVIRMNRTCTTYLNRAPKECQGRMLHELIPELAESIPKLIAKVLETGDIVESFNHLHLPVGERWFQSKLRPLYDEEGNIEQIQVVAHDVSEAQRSNEEMIKAHAELESMLTSISDGFFACDRDFTVTYFNEAAEKILGRKSSEILGRNLFDAFPEARGTVVEDNYRRALDSGNPIYFEFFFDAPPYENWYNVRAYPGENGITVYFQVTSQQKEAEKELQRYAESQAALVREVNHRVKNNLAAIQGLLNIERQRANMSNNSQYTETVDILRARIRGLSTIHSLLSESGWQPLKVETVIRRIINASMEGMPENTKVTVRQRDESLTVDSDQAHHLALAINELITNSFKYASPATEDTTLEIQFEIEAFDHHLGIVYTDNGPGFPATVIERPSTAGIGMELLHGLIQHSLLGSVKIDNQNGARITLTIPRHQPGGGN
jgi:PAS domain S-box-containing protein